MADSPKEEVSQIVPKKTNARTSIIHLITSFFRKLGTAGAIYLLGYFELSIAWLAAPVILSVLRDEWKKESEAKRINAQIAATSNEKDLVLAKLDDLPAWVCIKSLKCILLKTCQRQVSSELPVCANILCY